MVLEGTGQTEGTVVPKLGQELGMSVPVYQAHLLCVRCCSPAGDAAGTKAKTPALGPLAFQQERRAISHAGMVCMSDDEF